MASTVSPGGPRHVLKDALIKWQQSGVTILTRPPIIALQLGRFVGNAPDFRRVATRVDFQDPCVLEDLDGRVLVYEPKSCHHSSR